VIWFRQVTAPCNVACGSGNGIMTVNSRSGSNLQCFMCIWDGWHAIEFAQTSAILEFYIWFRFQPYSPQSTCHSAPVCEILSESDHPWQKNMTSCRCSRWRISAILEFRGPIMGSLKSPCTTSYGSSIGTIALNCFVFWENRVFTFWRQTDKQTDRRTNGQHRCTKPLSLSRAAA